MDRFDGFHLCALTLQKLQEHFLILDEAERGFFPLLIPCSVTPFLSIPPRNLSSGTKLEQCIKPAHLSKLFFPQLL